MTTVDIRNNTDLINYLNSLEQSTVNFFDSGEKSVRGLHSTLIRLHEDLEFNERMCRKIASTFKYFKGVFEGNNKTITVTSDKATSLFSSIYYSVIRNVKIHNTVGSRGLLLADDISQSTIQNVELTGILSAEESIGGFTRTSEGVLFQDCSVDIRIKSAVNDIALEQGSTEPIHFGGYVGVELGNTKFINCTISGEIFSEVAVGGFCATARKTTFENCSATDLDIFGKREVGLFVGRGSQYLNFNECKIADSVVIAGMYVGFMVGRTSGSIDIDNLSLENSFINPITASSFVGGIAGTADRIKLVDSSLSGGISGNFILAGVCPDVRKSEIFDNTFDLTVTASGYHPMMTHVYPLVRTDFLTTTGKDITFEESGNKTNIQITELEMEGFKNPFQESIL